jgi:hypothetical protein
LTSSVTNTIIEVSSTLWLLQYYIDVPSYFSQKGYHQENKLIIGEDIGEKGLLYTVGGSAN